jgi:hypothetical protein
MPAMDTSILVHIRIGRWIDAVHLRIWCAVVGHVRLLRRHARYILLRVRRRSIVIAIFRLLSWGRPRVIFRRCPSGRRSIIHAIAGISCHPRVHHNIVTRCIYIVGCTIRRQALLCEKSVDVIDVAQRVSHVVAEQSKSTLQSVANCRLIGR